MNDTVSRIIIDTDPGVDDALALLYCKQANLPIHAITTVYGNATLENVTNNARYITNSLKVEWPIYAGSSKPVEGKSRLAQSHGDTGLGNAKFDIEQLPAIQEGSAIGFIDEILSQELDITLLCLGPLTNLARVIKQYNPKAISKVIIMGGAFSEKGNVTDYAEFNFFNDIQAVKIVINFLAENNIPTVIIPVEVCRKVVLTPDDLNLLENSNTLPDVRSIVEPYLSHYLHDASDGKHKGAVLYDVLVPLYIEQPELFKLVSSDVHIELDNNEKYGQSTMSINTKSSISVAIGIDSIEAKNIVMQRLMG